MKLRITPALTIFTDDINVLRAAINEAEEQCACAEAAWDAANTIKTDWATLSQAESDYDAAVLFLAALEDRLQELEGRQSRKEEGELRADYYKSVL